MMDSIVISSDSPIVKAMKKESKSYADSVREAGPKHTLGAPMACVFIALLESMVEQDIGGLNKKTVTEFLGQLRAERMQDNIVRVCRWQKCHKDDKTKIIIIVHGQSIRKAILDGLRQLEGDVKSGRPPAGWMEDELGQWLEVFSGQRNLYKAKA